MSKEKEKLLLIGAKGDLGKKICKELKGSYNIREVDLCDDSQCGDEQIALIATPPDTHKDYVNSLTCKKIYCEKPFPDIQEIKNKENLKIIDHYLYKSEIDIAKEYYDQNKNRIKKIELFLTEEKEEIREWMKNPEKFGGVIYDLGHHLVSIIGYLLGFNSLNSVCNIQTHIINKFELGADKEVRCTFSIGNINIHLHIGKSIRDHKGIIFHLNDYTCKHFSLSDTVAYKNILEEDDKTLNIDNAIIVNNILNSIIRHAGRDTIESNEDSIKLIKMLDEDFKYRHTFYWSRYYRILYAFLFLSITPILLVYYFLKINSSLTDTILIGSGIMALVILCVEIYLFFIIREYLNEEEKRMKIPLNELRKLYKDGFNININPEGTEDKKGLGARYMIGILIILPILSFILSTLTIGTLYCNNLQKQTGTCKEEKDRNASKKIKEENRSIR